MADRPRRAFYRCLLCCHVVAHEGETLPMGTRCPCLPPDWTDPRSTLEFLGWVGPSPGRLHQVEVRCPCDERCTGAVGPICDCPCGGENHGTGRLVQVVHDMGAVPRLAVEDAATLRARAAEYLAARAPLRAERDALEQKRVEVRWLDEDDYARLKAVCRALSNASRLKTHAGRMRALSRVAEDPSDTPEGR